MNYIHTLYTLVSTSVHANPHTMRDYTLYYIPIYIMSYTLYYKHDSTIHITLYT